MQADIDFTSGHWGLRITAGISLLFFVWAFAAGGLARLMPNRSTRWLQANRRNAVLAFAASHTVHLGFIVAFTAKMSEAQFIQTHLWVVAIVGGAGFVLIYTLAWKAFRKKSTMAGDSRFEVFAYYYVWSIFALGYVAGAFRARFYVALAFVVFAALLLRSPEDGSHESSPAYNLTRVWPALG